MKVKTIKELIKDLPDDASVYLDSIESDYKCGITPVYPAKMRKYFSSSTPIEGYNVWGSWEETCSHEEYDGSRVQVIITSTIPLHYILVDDAK